MADTLNTLKTRRSCRAYKPEHIEEEKLKAILSQLHNKQDRNTTNKLF